MLPPPAPDHQPMSSNSIIFLFFLAQVMIALFALYYIFRNR